MNSNHGKSKIEVINLRNMKEQENARFTMSNSCYKGFSDYSHSSSQTELIIEALSEQVESIRNTIVLLEQRLTVVEDELKS